MATIVGILRAIGIIISPSSPSYFDSIMLLESIWLRSKIDLEKLLNSKIDREIELNGKITLK